MIHIIKLILIIVLGAAVGFGFWYLIFFFLTAESNPMHWHWVTKAIYLLAGFSSFGGITDEMTKNGL